MKFKIKELLLKNEKLIPQRLNKNFLIKNDIYDYINSQYDDTYTLSEKIYCLTHDLLSRNKCTECNNEIKFNHGYAKYCSRKCANNNIEVIEKNRKNVSISLLKAYENNGNEIKNKRKQTLFKKYKINVDSPFSIPEIKESIKNTIQTKYGVDNVFYLKKYRSNGRKISQQSSISFNKKHGYDIDYLNDNKILVNNICKIHGNVEMDNTTFYNRAHRNRNGIICPICNPINSFSSFEQDFIKILEKLNINNYIQNDRKIINPLELDFYFPEYNIAIELNGVYWHSELYKDEMYHKIKSDLCEDKGIQLIQIWEDDFYDNTNLIESILSAKFNKIQNRIFGRNCTIDNISPLIYRNFLTENHIQGCVNSSIKYGLFYEKELVSVMGFGKLRKPLGKTDIENKYELHRFCNKKNTIVIGGASKLFKHFEKLNNYTSILSYAKRDYSNGNLYNQLGFEYKGKTGPGFYWLINNKRKHRYNYRKDKISNKETNHLSAVKIMHNKGYIRCYDSGNLRFEKYSKKLIN